MDPNSTVEAGQGNMEEKEEATVLPSIDKQTHHSFENHMPLDIQKVTAIVISDDNSEPVTETHVLISEKEVASDSGIESKLSTDIANPVVVVIDPFDVILSESKETEGNIGAETDRASSPVAKDLAAESSDVTGTALDESNGVWPLVLDVVSKGIEPISDENQGVSSVETVGIEVEPSLDVQNVVSSAGMEEKSLANSDANVAAAAADSGGENCSVSEVLQSPKEQPLIAAMASPAQRTSWKGCCGLFQVLTRFNQ